MRLFLYTSLLFFATIHAMQAQVLDSDTRRELTLPDGEKLLVFAATGNSKQYYYLPSTLRLSERENRPEISVVIYRSGAGAPINGGLMHLLMCWGLTLEQERSAGELLQKQTDSQTVLMGAADISFPDNDMFSIEPTSGVAGILRRSLNSPVRLPALPGYKTAASFRFSGSDAEALANAIGKPQQLNGIKFIGRYSYTIAKQDGFVRSTTQATGVMEGNFRQWIDKLGKYNLLKIEKR